ncbi:hypothetical protein X768_23235 [Mesorhizobium sp. LSJC265A00]|nr:hypothetical protein X768_23235 [Mesorhizobium sp. LSJC265A00]
MAVIIDFSRLVAAVVRPIPSGNRADFLKLPGSCGNGAGIHMRMLHCLALTCICGKLAPKLDGTDANAAPSFQHR